VRTKEKAKAGPSTALRSGRDDNFVMRFTYILEENPTFLRMNCHPDRSAAGFPATQHSPTSTHAAFVKESRMKFGNATNINRKSGEAQ